MWERAVTTSFPPEEDAQIYSICGLGKRVRVWQYERIKEKVKKKRKKSKASASQSGSHPKQCLCNYVQYVHTDLDTPCHSQQRKEITDPAHGRKWTDQRTKTKGKTSIPFCLSVPHSKMASKTQKANPIQTPQHKLRP